MIDNDDDHTTCTLSEYIDAKELGPFLIKLQDIGVLSVDEVHLRNIEDREDIFIVVENSIEID